MLATIGSLARQGREARLMKRFVTALVSSALQGNVHGDYSSRLAYVLGINAALQF